MFFLIFNKVGGIWIHAEILNIPWNDNFKYPATTEFKAAKKVIEKEVNIRKIIKISKSTYLDFYVYN